MADDFGLKLGIEGEAEFKQALKDINSSFKVLGSEMTLVTSQFEKNDNSIEAVTARNRVLAKEIDEQKTKISTLSQALANASDSFGETDKRTQSWQIQLNKAKADLNNMERELKQNNDALDSSAAGFNDAEKQADQFGDEVKKAGNEAKDSGGKLERLGSIAKNVGKAMAVSFAAIGTATVAAGKAIADASVEAAAYADDMLTASTVTGMSTESLQSYSYAANLIDTSLETVTKSMGKNIKSMSSARDGSEAYAEAYKKLGVSVTDANGNLRDSETVYWECIDALGNVKSETERDAIAFQIFGKSAQELNPLIAQGSEGFAKLSDEAKSMGAVMSDEQLKSLGGFDDSIQRLKSTATGAKNAIGTVLVPELTALATDGTALLGEFSNGIISANGDWSKIGETVGTAITGVLGKLNEFMPHMSELAIGIVMALVTGITDNIGSIAESASQLLTTLVSGLSEALPQITESAVTLVLTLVEAILQNLPMLIEAALQVVITLANGIMQALIISFTTNRTYNNMSEKADQVINTIYNAYPRESNTDSRYFVVTFDASDVVTDIDLSHIKSVKRKGADAYAKRILSSGKERGFIETFRYGIFKDSARTIVICVTRGGNIEAFKNNLMSLILFSTIGFFAMFLLLIAASYSVTRPIAESYRKQKEFITSASHEMKTPLTVISADTDILLMDDAENEWLKDISMQTKRLTTMTHSMISLARMDEKNGKVTHIDFPVSDIAEDVAKSYKAVSVNDKKSFSTHIECDITYCGDENMIRQLFTILLDNAFKYSPDNGMIDFSLQQDSHQLILTVTNTSEPVSEEQLSRFFDRFYRSDNAASSEKKGYGLGLSIAERIVQSHNGKITAKSPKSGVVRIVAVLR